MSPETRRSTQGLDAGPAIQPSPGRAPTAAAAAAANTIATVSAAIQASAPVAGSANGGTTAPSSSGSGSRKPTVKRAINPMRKAIKKHLHKSSLPNEKGGGSPTSPDGDPSYPVTVPADGSAGSGPSHARTIAPSTSKAEHTAIDVIIQRLLDIGMSSRIPKTLPLKSSEILSLLQQVQTVLLSQPMLLELNAPIKIVGDIHGQFFDLMRIFTKSGWPPNSNYLFLGDYVDRGKQSLETILLLFAFKIRYKENFFLLRGNHECASISRVYGFYDECKRRASVKVWKNFVNTFNCLPIAAVVADKIFCVHGGLSPSLSTMDDIRVIPRPTDVPDFGLINDILWSDPSHTAVEWEDNDRGVSYCFGKQILNQFLQRHDFDLLARAHMVVEDGYEFFAGRSLVTIFSAPNYCEIFSNSGAVMIVERDLVCRFDLLQPTSQPSVTLQDEVVKADAAAAAAAGIEVDTAQAANGPMNKEGIGRHNDTIRKASREAAKILSSLPTKSSNSSNANAIVTNLPSSASAAPPNARWNPNTSSSLESALAASLHNQAESPSKMLSAGRKSSHKSPVPAPLSRLGG